MTNHLNFLTFSNNLMVRIQHFLDSFQIGFKYASHVIMGNPTKQRLGNWQLKKLSHQVGKWIACLTWMHVGVGVADSTNFEITQSFQTLILTLFITPMLSSLTPLQFKLQTLRGMYIKYSFVSYYVSLL